MVILACTTLVLLLIAGVMTYNLKTRLNYGIFQSVILGLCLSVPMLYMFIIDILNIIGSLLFKIAAILGGEDLDTLLSKMMADALSKNRGVSEVQISAKDVPSETEETDTEDKGDR